MKKGKHTEEQISRGTSTIRRNMTFSNFRARAL
jgi:hypothetical protein